MTSVGTPPAKEKGKEPADYIALPDQQAEQAEQAEHSEHSGLPKPPAQQTEPTQPKPSTSKIYLDKNDAQVR